MERSGWLGLGLGAASAVVVLLPLVVEAERRDVGSAVTLPDRLAGYSHLTGRASEGPPGRAVALWQHGFGVEFMDFPQAVVLAADDDVYRRLDRAEERAGAETQGDPGPMLLSPDGRQVALGDHDTTDADLELVDLASGDVVRRPVPRTRSVLPVAWSRDGTQVAYVSADQPTNPYRGRPLVGSLWVLDVDSGVAQPVPGAEQAWKAAFSPDGQRLAVQRSSGRLKGVAVVDLASSAVRGLSPGTLAGPEAWSPDGRLLAVKQGLSIEFVDVDGSGTSAPARVASSRWPHPVVLGWTGDREVVLLEAAEDVTRLVAQPLGGGEGRELTRVEGTSSYGVWRLQLASALLADLEVREAGDPDRGPLPPALRIGLALLLGLGVGLIAARVVPRRVGDASAGANGRGARRALG